MAAITGIVLKDHFPLGAGGSVPSGLYAEIWQIPAATDADTQTLTPIYVNPLYVIGAIEHTAIGATDTTVACTLIATIDSSNFVEVMIVGKRKSAP